MGDGFARHTPTLAGTKAVRALAVDAALLPHVGEALTNLAQSDQWLEVGDAVEAITDDVWEAIESWYQPMIIGAVAHFLGASPPYWLDLDGATHDEEDYPELFAALDAQFKNPGAGTFTLPDVADTFLVGASGTVALGTTGGEASHLLTVDELPAHSHTYTHPNPAVDIGSVGTPMPGITTSTPNTPTSSVGGGNAHQNLPPYLALNVAIFAGRLVP